VADEVVETRWLFGTVLDMLGISPSVAKATTNNVFAPPEDGEYFARSSIFGAHSCLTGKQYKLIKSPLSPAAKVPALGPGGGNGRGERQQTGSNRTTTATTLFDVLKDPGETRDLSKELPEVSRELRAKLDSLNEELSRRRETAPMPRINRDQLRELRALGYM
jgi:hypothetical protein